VTGWDYSHGPQHPGQTLDEQQVAGVFPNIEDFGASVEGQGDADVCRPWS
jgi:hypothetical protein